jgi:phosphatidylserine/phosphatidylglycerophosphate/cardiolipin synthase-like enzyme
MRLENQGLTLWYCTPDAPGPEGVVPTDTELRITVGLSPPDASNQIDVQYRTNAGAINHISAEWFRNDQSSGAQYFTARLPAFSPGDEVNWWIAARCSGRYVPAPGDIGIAVVSFKVGLLATGATEESPATELVDDRTAMRANTSALSSESMAGSVADAANTRVTGTVTDEDGIGLDGLVVAAYDVDLITDERLGYANTETGSFTVTYRAHPHPDLKVRVFDPVGRLLFESDEHPKFSGAEFNIGQIVVPKDVASGWRVTLRTGYHASSPPSAPVDRFPGLSEGNLVTPLVDDDFAWMALTNDVLHSEHFVHIVQLWFDAEGCWSFFDPARPQEHAPTGGLKLADVLVKRNRDKDVAVRILLNEILGDPGVFHSVKEFRKYLERLAQPHTVELRGFPRPYNNPIHAKIAVIDGRNAYLLGSPFIQGYFDGNEHEVDEPRRGVASSSKHTDCSPVHDVSVALRGPAVDAVDATFVELWGHVGTAIPKSAHVLPDKTNAAVQIVRTLPANLVATAQNGETGILEAYLRAIGQAEEFIFLDNQYFTEVAIADALVRAIVRRKTLEVIMVVNGKVDLPFYNSLQPELIVRMFEELNKHEDDVTAAKRLGVFTLWSHDKSSTPQRILRTYTHAKTAVVDDKWATIGSANLDGVSLDLSQHVIPPITQRDRREERAVEVNAVIFNNVHGLSKSSVPGDLRRTLWAEHLGLDAGDPILGSRPGDGWLPLWRSRAEAKRAGLIAIPPTWEKARVLEWRPKQTFPGHKPELKWILKAPPPDPREHLVDLGVTEEGLRHLQVETKGRSFDFKTGEWKK